ncbi:hypothetical protein [Corallincola luteus]|uniref:hypothetical protein n=1 Tax=Corallincola luteus TaxID=1775177 RepID=UPI0010393226|nr:hypothetical protein [Corallincola luteus]
MKKTNSSSLRRPFRFVLLYKSKFSDEFELLKEVDVYAPSFSAASLKAEKIMLSFQLACIDIFLVYKEFYLSRKLKQSEIPF